MAKYKIEFKRSVKKDLSKIPSADAKKVMARIAKLANEPCPQDSKKLSSSEKYRLRQGNYRILYNIEDEIVTIYIVKIGHRREAYRDL